MKKNLTIPIGMSDVLPEEAYNRRNLINSLMENFYSWGYQEVATSTLEFYDVVEKDGMDPTEVFKLIDREGKILALRPDVTTPIARMVATRFTDKKAPFRLCYTGSTYRYENIQIGRQREFTQAGVELIGAADLLADIEVLVLAIESLKAAGLEDFKIGIGEINITEGLIGEILNSEDDREEVKDLILTKDYVALDNYLKEKLNREDRMKIMNIVRNNGDVSFLEEIAGYSEKKNYQKALADLKIVADVLEDYGFIQYIFFDFSILRNFSYYTGIVFEGYASGLGHPICGGGRYDNLLGTFGFPQPAVGFALGVERVLLAACEKDREKEEEAILLGGPEYKEVLQRARELRRSGQKVALNFSDNVKEGK